MDQESPLDSAMGYKISMAKFVALIVSAILWSGVLYLVFFRLPTFHRMLLDMDLQMGAFTQLVTGYGSQVVMLLLALSMLSFLIFRSRVFLIFVALILPILLIAGLVTVMGSHILVITEQLS